MLQLAREPGVVFAVLPLRQGVAARIPCGQQTGPVDPLCLQEGLKAGLALADVQDERLPG